MSHINIDNIASPHNFTDQEISYILTENLPEWKKGCDNSQMEGLLFHPDAFGYSAREIILIGLALKYAALKGKEIRIVAKK